MFHRKYCAADLEQPLYIYCIGVGVPQKVLCCWSIAGPVYILYIHGYVNHRKHYAAPTFYLHNTWSAMLRIGKWTFLNWFTIVWDLMVYVLYCVKWLPPLFMSVHIFCVISWRLLSTVIVLSPSLRFERWSSAWYFLLCFLSLMKCLGLYLYKPLMTGLLALFVKAYAGLT